MKEKGAFTQQTFTCSKSGIEILEKGVEYIYIYIYMYIYIYIYKKHQNDAVISPLSASVALI